MNILIDGRPFIKTSAGISTVLRCTLVSWANQRNEDTLYVVLPKAMHKSMDGYVFPENVKWIKAESGIFQYLPNLIYLFFMVPMLIRKYKINVYYSPVPTLPFFIPKRVVTIVEVNDVVNLEFSETMTLENKVANALLFNRSIKKANILWAISKYTKERIEHYFPTRNCQDIFVGCAVDKVLYRKIEMSRDEVQEIKSRLGIKNKFLLFVGSLEPRKNLPFLLNLMPEIYRSRGIQLVVVGARGWKNSTIKDIVEDKAFPKDSTIFCGYISNEDLVKLYNIADCFVSPSLNEGFGLPQLEAFICGCPVVTAANSAMVEVAQNKSGGLLIKGYDKKEWIRGIISIVNDKPKVKEEEFLEYDWNIIITKLVDNVGSYENVN